MAFLDKLLQLQAKRFQDISLRVILYYYEDMSVIGHSGLQADSHCTRRATRYDQKSYINR